MHGYGEFKWDNGTIYQGEFSHNAITGQGKMVYTDGTIIIGKFINGVLQGR